MSAEQAVLDEAKIREEIETKLKAQYAKQLAEVEAAIREENKKSLALVVEQWRAEQQPPKPEEIEMLLNQEYFEFKVKLTDPANKQTTKEFVIREVPQKVEKRFIKKIEEAFLPRLKDLSSILLGFNATATTEDKMKAIVEAFSPSLDILAETVAIILDPFEEDTHINAGWVADNISSLRQWNIIYAQERANGIRDFFSRVSRDFLKGTTSGKASFLK